MTLLDQLTNDRYAVEEPDVRYRRGWNDAIGHAERLVRLYVAVVESSDGRALDMRVKHALTGTP